MSEPRLPACISTAISPGARKLVAEFIGSFGLAWVVSIVQEQVNKMADGTVAPLAIGFTLVFLVFAFGYQSGAHFNMNVSLAAYLVGALSTCELIGYWIVQMTGSLCGALLAWFVGGASAGTFPSPKPRSDSAKDITRAVFAELVGTFFLCSTVLHVAVSKQKSNNFYGLAIGLTLMSQAYAVGNISGGAFNTNIALGLGLASCADKNCLLKYFPLYLFSGFLAAFLAAIVYCILGSSGDDDCDDTNEKTDATTIPRDPNASMALMGGAQDAGYNTQNQ